MTLALEKARELMAPPLVVPPKVTVAAPVGARARALARVMFGAPASTAAPLFRARAPLPRDWLLPTTTVAPFTLTADVKVLLALGRNTVPVPARVSVVPPTRPPLRVVPPVLLNVSV